MARIGAIDRKAMLKDMQLMRNTGASFDIIGHKYEISRQAAEQALSAFLGKTKRELG